MKLTILGSSSAGNAYVLDNGHEALLVECGMPYRSIQKSVDFDISRIRGCVISHEHSDHAKHVQKVLDARIPCYMSDGTAEALKIRSNALVRRTEEFKPYQLGGFTIQGFSVQHDAAEPFGYLIHHKDMGTVLFATDTYYLKYRFDGLSNILLECNYRLDILEANVEAGRIAPPQRDRTLRSHMSYDTCRDALLANDLSRVNNIVLLHLSPANSHAADFLQGIKAATGKNVHIADKGMTIDFNKTPF